MKKKGSIILCIMLCTIVWCCSHYQFNFCRNATITIGDNKNDSLNNRIILMFPELDSIWKPTYQYAVIIPSDTTMNMYYQLIQLLNKNESYTKNNTFIICQEVDKESMEEAVPGYSVFVSDFIADNRYCPETCFYMVWKEDKKYLLTKKEI